MSGKTAGRDVPVRAVLAYALVLLLGACSAWWTRLETPRLSIVNLELLQGSAWEQSLRVRMRVQNPNDRALPVRGLKYTLELAGTELAQGVSNQSFTVPAFGESEFDMIVRASVAQAVLYLLSQKGQRDELDYRLVGRISLADGLLRSLSFEQGGTLKLK